MQTVLISLTLFVRGRLHIAASPEARSFNFTFCYIDDVLSLSNSKLGDFVDRIYPIKLEIKDTTDTARSASYFDNLGKWGPVKNETKEMISIFPFEHSSSICMYVYRVYVSRLIRYSRVCGFYRDFSDRWLLLTRILLNQGFMLVKFTSFRRHHDLVNSCEISV